MGPGWLEVFALAAKSTMDWRGTDLGSVLGMSLLATWCGTSYLAIPSPYLWFGKISTKWEDNLMKNKTKQYNIKKQMKKKNNNKLKTKTDAWQRVRESCLQDGEESRSFNNPSKNQVYALETQS